METEQKTQKEFKKVFDDIELTYLKNLKDKGDTWKTLSIDFLEKKFEEELKEFKEAIGMKDTYPELIDLILVSLMLANRLKKEVRNSSQD